MKLAKRLILIGVISGAAFAVSSLVSIYQSQMAKQVAMQSASELQDGEKALFIAVHAGAVFAQQRVAWKDVLLRSGNAESFKKSWEDFSALDRETNDSLHKLVQYQGRFGLEKADVENAIAQHAQVDAEFRDAYKDMNHGNAAAVPDPVAHHIADLTVKGLDRPTVDAIQLIVDKTYKTVTEQSEADAKKIDSSLSRVIIISLLVALAGIAAVAASLIVNGRAIFKQIGAEPDEVIVLASKIASGNLRVDDYSQGSNAGSVVYAMVRMREGLRDVIAELKTSSATISSSSEGIRNSAESVSVASAKQLDAAREMAAGIEEMSVSITHIEDSADSAKNTALQSHSSASSGSEVIGRMSGEIRHSDEAVREADAKLSNLVKQVTEVVTIVDTVKAIAEQTNLLALNAAIEAARAGEQGRGFAVVADEVRKLAEQTTTSTVSIDHIVATIRAGVEASSETMRRVSEITLTGLALSVETDNAITGIKQTASGTLSAATDIAAALHEQSVAAAAIARQVENISQMSESVSASAEKNVTDARSIEQQAESLSGIAAKFQL